ncbi:MAG: hypothetical protein ACK5RL_02035 [Acidimicrobiales bacterium]
MQLTDRIDVEGPSVVRIVRADGLPAQLAIAAVAANDISAALTLDEVEQVAAVASSVAQGISCLTAGVIHHARSMAILNDRQLEVVKLLALGLSNECIAERAHISVSTLKRELRALRSLTDCDDRASVLERLAISPTATWPDSRPRRRDSADL